MGRQRAPIAGLSASARGASSAHDGYNRPMLTPSERTDPTVDAPPPPDFAHRLIAWQRRYGRHDLPWQASRDPYAVWVSEIMLQQTQVSTVIGYFERFMQRLPDIAALAAADEDTVLSLWSGLGYYARARNLHAAARRIAHDFGGHFPRDPAQIESLPGIGRSTAAAIAAFCFGARTAILDGNVKRVLARVFGIEGFPGQRAVEQRMWDLAERLLPACDVDVYTQALMDLGATVCTRGAPRCTDCPLHAHCIARRDDRQRVLPAARPRRVRPTRYVDALLLVCAGRVLLEKRPPQGIWGGLYSLPELSRSDDATPALRSWLQDRGFPFDLTAERLTPVDHAFTHFDLRLQPWRIDLTRCPATMGKSAMLWFAADELDALGLPAPIARLLARVRAGADAGADAPLG